MKARELPSLEVLNSRFYIDENFRLLHKTSIGGVKRDSEVGHKTEQGYRRFILSGVKYINHRAIYFMVTGIDPMNMEVDHINGDRSDNRISNLRLTTRRQNGRNRKLNSNNQIGVKGVYWCKRDKAFKAFIKFNGKKINLGSYKSASAASEAYELASIKYFGEYRRK